MGQKVSKAVLDVCRQGDSDKLRRLLEASPKHLVIEDEDGNSPLHYAVLHNKAECVRLLSKAGADVNYENEDGDSPLHVAALKRHTKCLKIMLRLAGKPGSGMQSDLPDLDIANNDGFTPLHLAAGEGSVKAVEVLLKEGSDSTKLTANGDSALGIAAWKGHAAIVYRLIKADETMVDEPDVNGNTPLHHAIHSKNLACVLLLLRFGASIEHKDSSDVTAYDVAKFCGHQGVLNAVHAIHCGIQSRDLLSVRVNEEGEVVEGIDSHFGTVAETLIGRSSEDTTDDAGHDQDEQEETLPASLSDVFEAQSLEENSMAGTTSSSFNKPSLPNPQALVAAHGQGSTPPSVFSANGQATLGAPAGQFTSRRASRYSTKRLAPIKPGNSGMARRMSQRAPQPSMVQSQNSQQAASVASPEPSGVSRAVPPSSASKYRRTIRVPHPASPAQPSTSSNHSADVASSPSAIQSAAATPSYGSQAVPSGGEVSTPARKTSGLARYSSIKGRIAAGTTRTAQNTQDSADNSVPPSLPNSTSQDAPVVARRYSVLRKPPANTALEQGRGQNSSEETNRPQSAAARKTSTSSIGESSPIGNLIPASAASPTQNAVGAVRYGLQRKQSSTATPSPAAASLTGTPVSGKLSGLSRYKSMARASARGQGSARDVTETVKYAALNGDSLQQPPQVAAAWQ